MTADKGDIAELIMENAELRIKTQLNHVILVTK